MDPARLVGAHAGELSDNPSAGDARWREEELEPDELPQRPSTSQGFVGGVRSEASNSKQGRVSRSAHGRRRGGQEPTKSQLDHVSVPSPVLGGWGRRKSPARTVLRYGRMVPAVSNESSFDSPLNSFSIGVSTPLRQPSEESVGNLYRFC